MRLNRATRYTYDALSRLELAATTGSTSYTWTYQYDNASNRTTSVSEEPGERVSVRPRPIARMPNRETCARRP